MDLKETIPEYINIERQCRVCIHARGPAFITPISPTCGGCTAARPTTVAVMVTGLQPTCTKNLEPDSAACAGTCTILFADCHTRAMLGPSQRETCSAVSHTGCCVPIPSLSLSLSQLLRQGMELHLHVPMLAVGSKNCDCCADRYAWQDEAHCFREKNRRLSGQETLPSLAVVPPRTRKTCLLLR